LTSGELHCISAVTLTDLRAVCASAKKTRLKMSALFTVIEFEIYPKNHTRPAQSSSRESGFHDPLDQ
jgi:hypothetical protein